MSSIARTLDGLLRKLTRSKTTIFIVIGTYGCLYLRRRYPSSVLAVAMGSLVNVALYYFLCLVVAYAVLKILISFVFIPLAALIDDAGEESQEPVGQPTDEESLVPERGPEEPSCGLRGVLSLLADVFIFAGLVIGAASVLRPRGTGFLLGTWRVLMIVLMIVLLAIGKIAGMVVGALFFLPLLVSAPLIIIWAIAERITVEPHKSSWSHATALSTRITVGTFLYLLVIEGVSLYQPAHLETVVPHLAWQATLLSELFKWLGLGAYTCASLWHFTDIAARYLVNRAVICLSLRWQIAPQPLYKGFQNIAHPSKGIVSAAIVIAWITAGVFALLLFDVLVYWSYFYWGHRQRQRRAQSDTTTPPASDEPGDQVLVLYILDIMAITLFGNAIRDKTGRGLWDQMREEEEGATDVAAPSETSELKAVNTEMLGAEKNGSESSEKGEALV
ncbi:hypothetical protein DFH09DRAFT_1178615 [Mycena vulgaris]|nr:hypothetical protein DFH09DRAFT_1178615 [Mycena vulgaris]